MHPPTINARREPRRRWSLGYLLTCFHGYGPAIVVSMVSLLVARAAATADPVILKRLIDGIASGSPSSALGGAVAIYFALKLLHAGGELVRDWCFAPVMVGVGRRVSERVFEHLLRLPMAYHSEQQSGALARKIARGSRALTMILDFTVMNILPTLAELTMVTVLLLRLYPPGYGIVTLVTVVIYTWFTIWSTEKRSVLRLNANLADDAAGGIQMDSITNVETVKYFSNEAFRLDRFGHAIRRWYDLSVRSNQIFAAITAGQALILVAGMGLLMVQAVGQAAAGLLTVGDLVLLTTYVVRVSTPIGVLGWIYRSVKDGIADLDEMGRILQNEITIREPDRPVPLPAPRGEVRFEHIRFGYTGRETIFTDLNLEIRPGERVAVVGPSGSGKSTLVKLLFRLLEPEAGRVLIDGVDLRDLDAETRRRLFAIVPQEPVLFNETIAENVRFGKLDATREEIEQACRLANIHDFILTLPQGYDTVVGERGTKLSGGEKQRVAIARAVIRDPRILVFDEATSNLDSHSEQMIQEALERIAPGRTTLVIAHRLSTVVDSDRITVLDRGRVAEQGTHGELLARGGLYASLWTLQSRGEDEPDKSERPDLLPALSLP